MYTLTMTAKSPNSKADHQSSIAQLLSHLASPTPPVSNLPRKHPAQVVYISKLDDLFYTPYLLTELTLATQLEVDDLPDVL
jgi:hypothetical protein